MTTREELRRLTRDLGSTTEDVHATLVKGGYRGYRGKDCDCPVAKYLEQKTHKRVRVTTRSAILMELEMGRVVLPLHVARFIDRFDNGDYPDLDLEIWR